MSLDQPHQTVVLDGCKELSHNWIGMVASCQGRSSIGLPTYLSCLFAMHGPQYLSVMKANIQFLDFRYWQFELTCWSTYRNHTKLYSQHAAYVHYLVKLFLTGEL